MDHYKIIRDIQAGQIAPAYLLMGEESFYIDEVTNYIEKEVLNESERSFDQMVMYGRDSSLDQILSQAKAFPMLGQRQVLIIKEAQDLSEWKKTEQLDSLIHYLENPQTSTLLVFAYKNGKVKGNLKVAKAFKKHAVVFESQKVKDYKLPEWIRSYMDSRGKRINPDSANLLAEYLGNDLSKLVNELNKLCIVVPEKEAISVAHIEKNIGISKDYNVFEFQDALGEKNIIKANRIVRYYEANPKANPVQKIIPSLYLYFSKMLVYKTLENKSGAARVMGMAPWQLSKIERTSSNFRTDKLRRIISYLREVDQKSKGIDNYSINDAYLLKELVFKILHY